MRTQSFRFDFGDLVRDTISGIEGKVIGMTAYITGCSRYVIQPAVCEKESSKLPAAIAIDEVSLELVRANELPALGRAPKSGPPSEEVRA